MDGNGEKGDKRRERTGRSRKWEKRKKRMEYEGEGGDKEVRVRGITLPLTYKK